MTAPIHKRQEPAGDARCPCREDGEQALVERAAGGDGEAFASLYDRYVERLYRYAFRRLGTHADAEDLTAHTFRRAFEAIGRYEARGTPFGAWLFRIAHNLIVDRWRAGGETVSLDGLGEAGYEAHDDEARSPADAAELHEAVDAAWTAVAGLPALQRRAVTLRFGRDLSHAEVGVLIGRSEAATKQLIYRAMVTLRGRLAGDGSTGTGDAAAKTGAFNAANLIEEGSEARVEAGR